MTVVADVSLPSEEFHLGQALSTESNVELRLTQFVPDGDQLVPYFWAHLEESSDPATFEEQVRAHPNVARLDRLDGSDHKFLYCIGWTPENDPFLRSVLDHDVIVEAGSRAGSVWTFRLRADGRQTLSSVLTTCRAQGVPLSVESVLEPGDPTLPYGLTEKQRDALVLAYREGYFDDPSGVSLAELGEELGVSRQAVSALLDRAITHLIEGALVPSTAIQVEEPASSRSRRRSD